MRLLCKFVFVSTLPYFISHDFDLFHWVRGHVALIVFAGAVHLAVAASTHSIWLSVSAAAYYAHREQTSQAIAGNELSGSSDTHSSGREVTLSTSSQRTNIVPEKLLTNAESLLSSGQSHSIYLQPAGIVSPNCTFVCAAHRQREPTPASQTASEPPFIYSSIQMASSKSLAQCRLTSKANQLAYSLFACVPPANFWHRSNFALFFLFQITQFVLWSAQCEAAITQTLRRPFGYMRAPRVCGKTIGRNARERSAEQRAKRGGLIVSCCFAAGPDSSCMCDCGLYDCVRCEIESSFVSCETKRGILLSLALEIFALRRSTDVSFVSIWYSQGAEDFVSKFGIPIREQQSPC